MSHSGTDRARARYGDRWNRQGFLAVIAAVGIIGIGAGWWIWINETPVDAWESDAGYWNSSLECEQVLPDGLLSEVAEWDIDENVSTANLSEWQWRSVEQSNPQGEKTRPSSRHDFTELGCYFDLRSPEPRVLDTAIQIEFTASFYSDSNAAEDSIENGSDTSGTIFETDVDGWSFSASSIDSENDTQQIRYEFQYSNLVVRVQVSPAIWFSQQEDIYTGIDEATVQLADQVKGLSQISSLHAVQSTTLNRHLFR